MNIDDGERLILLIGNGHYYKKDLELEALITNYGTNDFVCFHRNRYFYVRLFFCIYIYLFY